MDRALTTMSWVWATLGVIALATVPFTGTTGQLTAIGVAAVVCVCASYIGWQLHGVSPVYAVVMLASAAYLFTFDLPARAGDMADISSSEATIDVAANLVLVVGVTLAVRARRGAYSRRDVADGLTVLLGAMVVAWIAIANPLIERRGLSPHVAILNSVTLPLSVILVVLIAALFASGLERNRSAVRLVVALSLNLTGDLLRGLIKSEVLDVGADDFVTAIYFGALFTAAAAFTHPSIARALEKRPPHYSVNATHRLTVLGCCLLLPIALTAAVPSDSTLDRVTRTTLAVLLIASGSLRLLHAIRISNRAEYELFTRSQVDELTGLPNRVQLISAIGEVLDDTWRTESRPSLMQVNLDRFKNINDSLGHELANEVLCELGARLRGLARDIGAQIARPSGDEFVILDRDAGSPAHAFARAEAVHAALSEPFVVDGVSVFVTSSIGLAVVPKNRTITPEEFLRRADIATHRAKANGRNCIALFDESMQTSVTQRMDMENALYGAVERRELRLYHQPIVEIETGRISGFEALIRWRRDDGTLVPPADFIFIAEETGLINTIGAWAMLEALTELRRWISEGIVEETTTISVNVSPRQIADPQFADIVQEALTRSGVSPHLLWLEVTESMMLSEPELARSTLRRVRAMGVRLALDDFGTGYSSLSLLQQFPLQRIKIDRAFIQGVADRANDRSLVRTIIAMGSSMGLDVVAEGVESIHQLRVLRDIGCDKAQGYLISHPIPADAMRSTMVALSDLGSLGFFGPATRPPEPTMQMQLATRSRSHPGLFENS
ncbi:MAG TPA: bifunctional diguanylate cyclase/phosphodiesterase [Ilumatobacteraceae bacterium]|nr:bifunctional diguanylate cyclase/phosphodiesterase [Ilumatobacteraceae bacterium]